MAGWNFRRRMKLSQGVHLNIGKKGISTSVGPRGASMTFGPNGTYLNTSIPGTGMYKRQKITGKSTPSVPSTETELQIRSGCIYIALLIVVWVAVLIIVSIYNDSSEYEASRLTTLCWIIGSILTLIILLFWGIKTFCSRSQEESLIKAQVKVLSPDVDDDKSRILRAHANYLRDPVNPQSYYDTLSTVSKGVQVAYEHFCEAFADCLGMSAVWQMEKSVSNEGTKMWAGTSVVKKLISWCMADNRPYVLPNPTPAINTIANGPIYFFPQFALHYTTATNYEVWSYEQIKVTTDYVRFQETADKAPADSEAIDKTWAYVNKDGGPDLRYSYNPLMLVLKYGEFIIDTPAGIFTYYTSQYNCIERLGKAFQKLQYAVIGPLSDIIETIKTDLEEKNIAKPTTTTLPAEITRSYFVDITQVVHNLYNFVEKEIRTDVMQNVLGSSHIEINFGNGKLTDKREILHTLIWMDMIVGHLKMNHKIDTRNPQSFGLLLYYYMQNNDGRTLSYENSSFLTDKFYDSINGFLNSLANYLRQQQKRDLAFQSIQILSRCGTETLEEWKIKFYRYLSVATKGDGKVSPLEECILSSIMMLSPTHIRKDDPSNHNQGNKVKRSHEQSSEDPIQTLNQLVGLSAVKKDVETLKNFIKIQQLRAETGLKISSMSYHCVFTGNPGTGKTTVARIVASIYKEMGVLKKGHLVETDRAGLVAEYVGQTAAKTHKKIDEALDGVLFIDEAYSLIGQGQDYGKEAIATLLKRMEDDRERLVVILAGYTDEMTQFINTNPGLQSRFNRYIDFPDYSAIELMQIFTCNLDKYEYVLSDEAVVTLANFFEDAVAHKDKNFGNARFVRNIFEKTLERQANRLASVCNLTSEKLSLIEVEDLPIK